MARLLRYVRDFWRPQAYQASDLDALLHPSGTTVPVSSPSAPVAITPPGERPGTLQDGTGRSIPTDTGLPHVYRFSSLINVTSRTYSHRWDEAYRRRREDALAMRRDCFLMSLLRERQYPTAQMGWHLEGERKQDPAQQQAANYFEALIRNIPDLEQMHMSNLEHLWYGRYGAQLTWGNDTIAGCPAFLPVSHDPVNGDKIQFSWEGEPSIQIYSPITEDLKKQGATVTYSDAGAPLLVLNTPAWRDRFIITTADVIDADFWRAEEAGGRFGVGIRHWVYWYWWLKTEIMEWMISFLERTGLGLTIFYYEESNDVSLQAAIAAAKSESKNTVLLMPRGALGEGKGSGIERIEVPTSGAEFILKVIEEYFDRKIERLVIGQSASSRSETSGMGTHDNSAQQDTKYRIIKSDCTRYAGALTRDLVLPLVRYNQPNLGFKLRWVFDVDKPNPEKVLEAVGKAWEMGVTFDMDEVRALTGLSDPPEGAKILVKQEPAAPPAPGAPQPLPFGNPGGGSSGGGGSLPHGLNGEGGGGGSGGPGQPPSNGNGHSRGAGLPFERRTVLLQYAGPAPAAPLVAPQPSELQGWSRIVLEEASNLRILGPTSSGKTTIARALAAATDGKLFVIDPVYSPGAWGELPAVTVSPDGGYEPIRAALIGLLAEMARRGAALQAGTTDFPKLTILFDEVPDTVAELPKEAGLLIRRLGQRGRHGNMHLIGLGQSDRVQSWGIGGYGDAAENFATIYLDAKALEVMPELTGTVERPAVLEWKGQRHPIDLGEVVELAKRPIPASRAFQLPVVAPALAPVAAPPPDAMGLPFGRDDTQTPYESRTRHDGRFATHDWHGGTHDALTIRALLERLDRLGPCAEARGLARSLRELLDLYPDLRQQLDLADLARVLALAGHDYGREGEPRQYGKGKDEGRWITIGGKPGPDGKKHGGSPVFIRNGRIEKGHPSLTGKKITSFKEADTPHEAKESRKLPQNVHFTVSSAVHALANDPNGAGAAAHHETLKNFRELAKGQGVDAEKVLREMSGTTSHKLTEDAKGGGHRKQLQQAKGHARAVWGKKAKAEGLDPKHLHTLAAEFVAHDEAHVQDRVKLLQDARKLSKSLGYGDLTSLKARAAKGGVDADSFRGLDDVAERIAERYPEQFAGHEGDKQERLFSLLAEGNPEPMSEDEAYQHAYDYLVSETERDRYDTRDTDAEDEWAVASAEEGVPFGREDSPEEYGQGVFWEESEHPRDKGKFAEKAGAKGKTETAKRPTKRPATPSHADAMSAIPEGELQHVAGFPVRNLGKGQYRLETDKGHVSGTAAEVSARIDREIADQKPDRKRAEAALARVDAYTEPNFFTDPAGVQANARAFAALPKGARVVSLDEHTRGRLGQIVKTEEGNRVKLDGVAGYAGNNVEPLEEKHSWRVEKKEEATERPTQGAFFGLEESADAPDSTADLEALARLHASHWNALQDAGSAPDQDEVEAAAQELDGSNWTLRFDDDADSWVVERDEEPEAERYAREALPWLYEQARAPRGGVVISGKRYAGGTWIPSGDVSKSTPATREKVAAAGAETKAKRSARSVDVAALRERLQPHMAAHKLTETESRSALASLRALRQHHGDLTAHRIQELIEGTEARLAETSDSHTGVKEYREHLGKRLKALGHMLEKETAGKGEKATESKEAKEQPKENPDPYKQLGLHVNPDIQDVREGRSVRGAAPFVAKDKQGKTVAEADSRAELDKKVAALAMPQEEKGELSEKSAETPLAKSSGEDNNTSGGKGHEPEGGKMTTGRKVSEITKDFLNLQASSRNLPKEEVQQKAQALQAEIKAALPPLTGEHAAKAEQVRQVAIKGIGQEIHQRERDLVTQRIQAETTSPHMAQRAADTEKRLELARKGLDAVGHITDAAWWVKKANAFPGDDLARELIAHPHAKGKV